MVFISILWCLTFGPLHINQHTTLITTTFTNTIQFHCQAKPYYFIRAVSAFVGSYSLLYAVISVSMVYIFVANILDVFYSSP